MEQQAPSSRRAGSVAAALNGKMYVVGGFITGGGLTSAVEAYDPTTNTWTIKAPIPSPMTYAGAAAIGNKLYFVGGSPNDNNSTTGLLQIYDSVTNTWSTGASMPTPRTSFVTGVIDGKLYAAGGQGPPFAGNPPYAVLEVYDPATNTWTTKTSMATVRRQRGRGHRRQALYRRRV